MVSNGCPSEKTFLANSSIASASVLSEIPIAITFSLKTSTSPPSIEFFISRSYQNGMS